MLQTFLWRSKVQKCKDMALTPAHHQLTLFTLPAGRAVLQTWSSQWVRVSPLCQFFDRHFRYSIAWRNKHCTHNALPACSRSVTFWFWSRSGARSGSADPYLWLTDPYANPLNRKLQPGFSGEKATPSRNSHASYMFAHVAIRQQNRPLSNWMIYRGPGFLVVVLFGSTPTSSPPLSRQQLFYLSQPSQVSTIEHTEGRRGERVGMESNYTQPQETLVLYK